MINLTPLIRPWFVRRTAQVRRSYPLTEKCQRLELARLLARAADTEWGRRHNYRGTASTGDEDDSG